MTVMAQKQKKGGQDKSTGARCAVSACLHIESTGATRARVAPKWRQIWRQRLLNHEPAIKLVSPHGR